MLSISIKLSRARSGATLAGNGRSSCGAWCQRWSLARRAAWWGAITYRCALVSLSLAIATRRWRAIPPRCELARAWAAAYSKRALDVYPMADTVRQWRGGAWQCGRPRVRTGTARSSGRRSGASRSSGVLAQAYCLACWSASGARIWLQFATHTRTPSPRSCSLKGAEYEFQRLHGRAMPYGRGRAGCACMCWSANTRICSRVSGAAAPGERRQYLVRQPLLWCWLRTSCATQRRARAPRVAAAAASAAAAAPYGGIPRCSISDSDRVEPGARGS